MTNSDVTFTTKFRLDLSPKRVIITDTIDYSGLGEDPNNFKGVLMISGPNGTIYNNTDFDNPDIDPGISKESTTQINLPLDPLNNYEVKHGEYTVKYTVKKTTTEEEFYSSDVYNFEFNEPEMEVDIDSGPYSAKLRSYDNTDYGSDISNLDREHRIKYPTDLGFADIVVTTASHEVDPIYTNEWETIITSTVDYKQTDDLEYRWYGTESKTHCVTGACISSFYNYINQMLTEYQTYIGTNPNKAALFRERLQQINTAWQLLDISWMYNDYEEADKQSEVIRELIESSGIDLCPSGSSQEVLQCPEWAGGQGGGFYTEGEGINIANFIISQTNFGQIKVSTDDTTPGFIENKLSISHGANPTNIIELTTLSPGGDETLQLQFDESKISHDNIADVSVNDHHNQAHSLATTGDHTGVLPLTDLGDYSAGGLMYGGVADWGVLSPGTEGDVLKMGATYPEWSSSSGAHGDHTGHVTSSGLATTLTVSGITGQTELTSGLVSTDELVLSDAGVIKRMDISVLETYMQNNLNFSVGGFWEKSGDDIKNANTGNVGVGAYPGAYKFDVTGKGRFTDVIRSDQGIKSDPFISSGFTGSGYSLWEDTSKYFLELDNLKVRGRMDIFELVINKWRAVNGVLWVTDVADTYEDIDGGITAGIHIVSTQLTGTVDVVQNSTNVTGTNTLFTTELQVGDEILIDASTVERHIVAAIVNDEQLTLQNSWQAADDSGVNAYKREYYINIGKEGSSFAADDLIVAQKYQSPNVVRFEYRVNQVVDATDYWKVYIGDEDKWSILTDPTEDVTGHTFLKQGNTTDTSRQGSLVLDSNDTNNPYMDILDDVDSFTVDFNDIKVRIGNLEGLAGQGIVPPSPGYGFYSDNVYLSGKIIISNPGDINAGDINDDGTYTDDTAADAAQATADANETRIPTDPDFLIDFQANVGNPGLYLDANKLGYWSGSAWKTYMAKNGDFYLDGTSGYLAWVSATETLTIRGTIITVDAEIGGWDVSSSSIHHGAEKLTDDYAEPGTATIQSNGSLHFPNFYVNDGGETGIREVEEVLFKVEELDQGIKIAGREIWEDVSNSDYGSIRFNYGGYQRGTTKSRSTYFYNGKHILILSVGGIDNEVKTQGLLNIRKGVVSDINYITADDTLTFDDYITIVDDTSERTVTLPLPQDTKDGEQHWIKRGGSGGVTIDGNGNTIRSAGGDNSSISISGSRGYLLVWSDNLNKWAVFGQD